ncbi:MAG: UDP-galactopyranose mutase [Chloroflexota bacterium]
MNVDVLVVGAGFAGSVVAERLASQAGKRVLVVDRRSHVGGNAFDRLDDAGILIHQYGPHIFHTNSDEVFAYLSQFTKWRDYEHRVLASVDKRLVPIPINLDTVNRLYGLHLTSEELAAFFAERAVPLDRIETSRDVIVSKVGVDLYEKFFQGYTRKQWGLDPTELDATVAGRIPVRTDRDDRYFTDRHQAMPLDGYTAMFGRILDHPNIEVALGEDYHDVIQRVQYDEVVYTGPVDAFFDYRYGPLPYRSLDFRFETHEVERFQQTGTINFPNDHDYTRITEFKHLTGQQHASTTLCYEYPQATGDPFYPIPRPENAALYQQYEALAAAVPNVHFAGRLGTYRYYNMDQTVAQALALFASMTGERKTSPAA